MSTMIIAMATGNRYNLDGFLFRADRAYKVDSEFGLDLLEKTDNDLPKFKQIREATASKQGLPIINLTEEELEEEEEEEPEEPEEVKPVRSRTVSKKTPAALKRAAKKQDQEAKQSTAAKQAEDEEIEEV